MTRELQSIALSFVQISLERGANIIPKLYDKVQPSYNCMKNREGKNFTSCNQE